MNPTLKNTPTIPAASENASTTPAILITRRQMGVGLLALAAGGLGLVKKAQAFPAGASGHFNAASTILGRYGVTVAGDNSGGHDQLELAILQLPGTEYTQVVGTTRNALGELDPCLKTSVLDDDAEFIHFHPTEGGIIPCVKTKIEGHALATHELFDAEQGGIIPCYRVTADMLDGGHIGTIVATHFHPTEGGIIPCVRTTIEGHSLATYELLDAAAGAIVPCVKVESAMLEGGAIGAVAVTIDPDLPALQIVVGTQIFNLRGGVLAEQIT